ncbi:MAG: pYEATS domain-containing protein [Pseudomonadota bacterium]
METRIDDAPPLTISATLTWLSLLMMTCVAVLLADGVGAFAAIMAAALAAGMGGAALGFLFGIPRSVAAGAQPSGDAGAQAARAGYAQNTNLEQISDWLTKIVVGVGLVEAKPIAEGFERLSANAAAAWNLANGATTAGAIMLVGAVVGFLSCYVWTRTEFITSLQRADDDRTSDRQRRINAENEKNNMVKFLGGGPAKSGETPPKNPPAAPTEPRRSLFKRAFDRDRGNLTEHAAHAKIFERVAAAAPDLWDTDDNKHRFGDADIDGGKRLEAVVEPLGDDGQLCGVTLRVRALPGAAAVEGAVVFHLHPTFNQPVVRVQAQDGVAETRIIAAGAFTVGAVVESDGTRLELDLAELPNIPERFRNA